MLVIMGGCGQWSHFILWSEWGTAVHKEEFMGIC